MCNIYTLHCNRNQLLSNQTLLQATICELGGSFSCLRFFNILSDCLTQLLIEPNDLLFDVYHKRMDWSNDQWNTFIRRILFQKRYYLFHCKDCYIQGISIGAILCTFEWTFQIWGLLLGWIGSGCLVLMAHNVKKIRKMKPHIIT